jgi:hypothetical protein
MNYIKRLEAEKAELERRLANVREMLTETMTYLTTDKFAGVENDYVHVRTDMLPRLGEIRNAADPRVIRIERPEEEK